MLQTTIVTKNDLSTRFGHGIGTRKVNVTHRELNNRLNEVIMKKNQVGVDYLENIQALKDRIAQEQQIELLKQDESDDRSIVVAIDTGRRYDKILMGWMNKDRSFSPLKVRYFVERETGEIYGAKSELAPNLRWYFGSIYTAEQWDWSGHHAVPKGAPETLTKAERADPEKVEEYQKALDEACERVGVRTTGSYSNYIHFEKNEDVKKTKRRKSEKADAEKVEESELAGV
jgi:hypothetical protein